jgi:hypothetical protein
LVTNSAARGNLTAGQPVTVHLPSQSLRVLAPASQPATVAADA